MNNKVGNSVKWLFYVLADLMFSLVLTFGIFLHKIYLDTCTALGEQHLTIKLLIVAIIFTIILLIGIKLPHTKKLGWALIVISIIIFPFVMSLGSWTRCVSPEARKHLQELRTQ